MLLGSPLPLALLVMLPERLPPCSGVAGETEDAVEDVLAATAGYEINCCCGNVDLMAPAFASSTGECVVWAATGGCGASGACADIVKRFDSGVWAMLV